VFVNTVATVCKHSVVPLGCSRGEKALVQSVCLRQSRGKLSDISALSCCEVSGQYGV
jgi:hypothetical protein